MLHRSVAEFDVLYADWIEGEAIYLLVQIPGEIEPRFYRLPWSIKRAEDLQEAMTEAGEREVDLKIGNPFFDPDVEDRERLFYAKPQRSPPRKGTLRIVPAKFDPNDPKPYYGEQDQ